METELVNLRSKINDLESKIGSRSSMPPRHSTNPTGSEEESYSGVSYKLTTEREFFEATHEGDFNMPTDLNPLTIEDLPVTINPRSRARFSNEYISHRVLLEPMFTSTGIVR